jgi:hypothetical protein
MSNLLDTLEALERAATPGPWAEVAESGDWWVEGAEGIGVCESNEAWNHQGDVNLMVAARNALPALLRLARAVREERAAALAMDKALTDEAFRTAAARYNRATLETATALDAVGEEGE